MTELEKKTVNVILGLRISIFHVIAYNILLLTFYEILIAFWAAGNSWFNLTAALLPLEIYACTAVPSYFLVTVFLMGYKKLSFSTSKILWYLLLGISLPITCLCGVGSVFIVPNILSDGNEGWSIVFSLFVFPPFIVFSTVCILLLEKKKINLFKQTFHFDDEGNRIDPKYE